MGGGSPRAMVSDCDKGFGGAATCGIFGLGVAPTGSADLLKKLQERNLEAGDSDALRRSEEQEEDESWALLMMQDLRTFLQQKQPTTQVKAVSERVASCVLCGPTCSWTPSQLSESCISICSENSLSETETQ